MVELYLVSKCSCSQTIIVDRFLAANPYKNIALYGTPKDELLEELLTIANRHELYLSNDHFLKLLEVHDTLEILNEPEIENVKYLLSQPGIQHQLMVNTWLILSNITIDEINGFFSGIQLKIGLNANIFFAIESNGVHHLVQVKGTGTHELEIEVRKQDILVSFFNGTNPKCCPLL